MFFSLFFILFLKRCKELITDLHIYFTKQASLSMSVYAILTCILRNISQAADRLYAVFSCPSLVQSAKGRIASGERSQCSCYPEPSIFFLLPTVVIPWYSTTLKLNTFGIRCILAQKFCLSTHNWLGTPQTS